MIPVTLKMRNFMCYRQVPPLSFEGIHTACLSGDNGSGKSAIIDAMTWALWGKARTRSDDDLIHTREREMEVEFDFRVDNQLFRVIRKRSRPKKASGQGQPMLDFQIATDGGFRSLAGNSITQTEEKIRNTLHMDYDTFVNSAYLRQGHADEFTTALPSKRKEVLANILGLSDYDILADRAKAQARQKENEKFQAETSLREINEELARKPVYEAEFDRARAVLAEAEKQAKEREARLTDLRQQKARLDSKQAQLEQFEASMRDKERNLTVFEEQARKHSARVNEYEVLTAQREMIEAGYAQLVEARRLNDELNQKLSHLVKLNERRSQLLSTIEREKAKLTQSRALLESKVDDLKAKARRLDKIRQDINQLQATLGQLDKSEQALARRKQAGDDLQKEASLLESSQSQLEHDIADLTGKVHLLETETGAKCPLCEGDLTPEGLQLIRSKYIAERETKTAALQSVRDQLTQRKKDIDAVKGELEQTEANLKKQRGTVEGGIAVLKRELAEAGDAERQIDKLKEDIAEVDQRLTRQDFAVKDQEALAQVEADIARLDYDAGRHEQVRQQVRQFESFESRQRDLDNAAKNINQEKSALASAEQAAAETRHGLEGDTRRKQELTAELSALPSLAKEVAQAEAEYQTLLSRQKQVLEALYTIKAKLDNCLQLEIKKKEKEDLLNQAAREEDIYKELARAFGKTGVQALLIEIALPEIQDEANQLLSRMTDNRMHVKFDTQKETKKGDTVETLAINIADELGTRSYEMFSGGEAFRINFAVRIALSRLLARRAGARLPTLIIDEGFGTQDAAGIEKLKEAITSIQDDFEKIIVTTHIEELRDAFPTRIDVVKEADGSKFSVS